MRFGRLETAAPIANRKTEPRRSAYSLYKDPEEIPMAGPIPFDRESREEQCSRSEFKAQCDQLEALLREAEQVAIQRSEVPAADRHRAEMALERDIENRLQRLILRAKGMVSEEMLVRHQREIPVDEIPDYAVTHLLVELGEKELQNTP